MANVVVKLRIMPDSPDVKLDDIKKQASKLIEKHNGYIHKIEEEPVAFGLVSIIFIFLIPEAQGATDKLEEQIKTIEHVQSVEVMDVRRAVG